MSREPDDPNPPDQKYPENPNPDLQERLAENRQHIDQITGIVTRLRARIANEPGNAALRTQLSNALTVQAETLATRFRLQRENDQWRSGRERPPVRRRGAGVTRKPAKKRAPSKKRVISKKPRKVRVLSREEFYDAHRG